MHKSFYGEAKMHIKFVRFKKNKKKDKKIQK